MNNRLNTVGTRGFAAGLFTGIAVFAFIGAGEPPESAKEPNDAHVKIRLEEAPQAVRDAALRIVPGGAGEIGAVEREADDGIVTYDVEFTDQGKECSATFSEAGIVIAVERGIEESALPAAALAAVKARYPGATFSEIQSVQESHFELKLTHQGKVHEVEVDAAGDIDDDDSQDDDGHDPDGD